MATSTCYFLVALVCGAVCNPLGQATICETQNRRNGLTQALGSTTVCDATSNLLGRGHGHGLNMQGAPYLPSHVNGPFCPYGTNPGYGSTTVYENVPNICPGLGGLGGLGGCSGLSPVIPSSTTVTASIPNLGLGIGGNAHVGPARLDEIVPCSTTACTSESTPYFGTGLRYGVPYYPHRACQTNMCESMNPNLGLGTGCIGYGGACGLDANVPVSNTVYTCERSSNFEPGIGCGVSYYPNSAGQTTICESVTPNLGPDLECNGYGGACGVGVCESTPIFGPGLRYGGPHFPNSAGQTTICESVTPNLGLGIGCNVCGLTSELGAIFPDSATVCPCESTPNFEPGVCCGGPYFPNRSGQINIYESVPNVSPGYLYGIPTCNSFGPGLGYGYH